MAQPMISEIRTLPDSNGVDQHELAEDRLTLSAHSGPAAFTMRTR
jgi:hypothetical protein